MPGAYILYNQGCHGIFGQNSRVFSQDFQVILGIFQVLTPIIQRFPSSGIQIQSIGNESEVSVHVILRNSHCATGDNFTIKCTKCVKIPEMLISMKFDISNKQKI